MPRVLIELNMLQGLGKATALDNFMVVKSNFKKPSCQHYNHFIADQYLDTIDTYSEQCTIISTSAKSSKYYITRSITIQ